MKTLTFNENQCVKINNEEEFRSSYPFLRSAKNGQSFEVWLSVNKLPNFPIYLEHAGNIGIGYRDTPFCTWTGNPLEILNLNESLK